MTFERAMLLVICFLVLLNVMFLMSGCAMLRQARDVILGKPEIVIPDTPKEQLWQTIKGLTPNWLAIPVIAMGGVVMWYGSFKLGMAFVIFGSINLFMALATSRFGFWMALCGLIGTIAALASAMLAKNKAVKELIFGAQKLKEIVIANVGLSKAGANLILTDQQKTKSTKKIVRQIKTKAKLKGQL